MTRYRLILASASPRRKRLLTDAGLVFEVKPCEIDESFRHDETPVSYARRMAEEKAITARAFFPKDWILSADTVVTLDGDILGKPVSREDAASILKRLSGRTHQVITAFCIVHENGLHLDHCLTDVAFRPLTPDDIHRYIQSDEVWDKAGAYGIQGMGAFLTERVEGSYTNVVGLPLAEVLRALEDLGLGII